MRVVVLGLALLACGGDGKAPDPDAPDGFDGADGVDGSDGVDGTDGSDGTASETDGDVADTVAPVCLDDVDCRLPCAEGQCQGGQCVYAGADSRASGCAVGEPPACVAVGSASAARDCFFCNPFEDVGGYSAHAFSEGFEVGASRVLIEKLTPSPVSWTLSSARAASGARSLYFGDASLGSYDAGERAAARAVTPALALPEGDLPLVLSFQLFADTEETPGFDRLSVSLVAPDAAPITVWTSDEIGGTTLGEFLPVTVELGPVPSGAHLAFEADTVDEKINGFEGFYLDDVRVRSRCCDAEHGCDDGNACTSDTCSEGECAFVARAGCCLADVDCDDGDACSDDECALEGDGGSCVYTPRSGCCAVAGDCADDDPCTEDRCDLDSDGGGGCRHVPVCCATGADCEDGDSCTSGECLDGQCRYRSTCCRDDADCDDGISCTSDGCEAGVCRNEFTYEAGCCIPDVLTERFDNGTPAGWTLSPPTTNIGWHVHADARAPSGASVLYYGHPTLGFYDSGGRNLGTATSRLVRLPDGVELRLSFMVFIDVEENAQRDLFRVEALIGQEVVVLADKSELSRSAWQEVQVDLTWAASQPVQIRFVFDTVDGAQNTTRGVMIDDVRLLSSCLPRRCGLDAECGSRASCIEGRCEEGVCRYGGGC